LRDLGGKKLELGKMEKFDKMRKIEKTRKIFAFTTKIHNFKEK
jgi:hypothetical protein